MCSVLNDLLGSPKDKSHPRSPLCSRRRLDQSLRQRRFLSFFFHFFASVYLIDLEVKVKEDTTDQLNVEAEAATASGGAADLPVKYFLSLCVCEN